MILVHLALLVFLMSILKIFIIFNRVITFILFLPRGIGISIHKLIMVEKGIEGIRFFEYKRSFLSYYSP